MFCYFVKRVVISASFFMMASLVAAQSHDELVSSGSFFGQEVSNEGNHAQLRTVMVAQVVKGIISYVRWPDARDETRLCVVAPTQYADGLLRNEDGTTQRSLKLTVVRVLVSDLISGSAPDCASVYIGKLDLVDENALLQKLIGRPILTISEEAAECNNGSLFCLRISDERVGFEVNLDSVARSGLRVNPQVLKLGKAAGAD